MSFSSPRSSRPAADAGSSDSSRHTSNQSEKHSANKEKSRSQPPLSISLARNDDQPRTTSSASSSLDPYYFQDPSPTALQLPPMPMPPPDNQQGLLPPATTSPSEPTTPGRDPASIDRRALIGVGELATPRWTSNNQSRKFNWDALSPAALMEEPEREILDDNDDRDDGADSPWTIEAVDGDQDVMNDTDDIPPDSASVVSPVSFCCIFCSSADGPILFLISHSCPPSLRRPSSRRPRTCRPSSARLYYRLRHEASAGSTRLPRRAAARKSS
ncbi:hypothetical protein EXIGLDRAFT_675930, partial [Exidia glandulosa HHB12029]